MTDTSTSAHDDGAAPASGTGGTLIVGRR